MGWAEALVSSLRDGVVVTDADNRIVDVNEAFCRMTGFGREALLAAAPGEWPPLAHPDLRAAALDAASAMGDGAAEFELEILRADGSRMPVRVSAAPLVGAGAPAGGYVGVVRDVSDLRRAEAALRAERDRSAALLEAVADGLAAFDALGRITMVNERMCRMVGRPSGELVGRGPGEYPCLAPEDQGAVAALLARGGGEADLTLHRADGSTLPAMVSSTAVAGAGGIVLLCTIKDVSGRQAAEASVRAERDRFARIVGALLDGLVLTDDHGRIAEVNAPFCEMTGFRPEELVGRGLAEGFPFLSRESERDLAARWPGLLASGHAEFEQELLHRDGHALHTLISAARLPLDGAGIGHVLSVKDRTAAVDQRRDLEVLAAEQAALVRVATAAIGAGDAGHVLDLASAEAARLLRADIAAMLRVDGPRAARWVSAWGRGGLPDPALTGSVGLEPTGALARSAAAGRPVRVDDLERVRTPLAAACRAAGMRSLVTVPVRAGARLWGGIVVLAARPGAFGARDEELLAPFAEVVSLALSAADARAELAAHALRDPLTGLPNHRAFFARLQGEIARARRSGAPLSLAMLDLDRFKLINDLQGHQAGDRALAEVARAVAACAREGEMVARIGGDEFAWLLPGADAAGARAAGERARQAVHALRVDGAQRPTLSIGVAELRQARDLGELVHLADGALYHAKSEGRDRVVPYAPDVVIDFSAEERAAHVEREQAVAGLRALARAVDAKDPDTREHSVRVGGLSALLARARGWDHEAAERLREAALVHDVGKIGIPDRVLFKPGRLDEAEYLQVQEHAALGAEIADEVLTPAQVAWVRGHHERWDGGGYPDGMAGQAIPEGARILALADAWDVMLSVRAYKDRMSVEEALAECRRCAGAQFDPALVSTLARLWAVGLLARPPGAVDAAEGLRWNGRRGNGRPHP